MKGDGPEIALGWSERCSQEAEALGLEERQRVLDEIRGGWTLAEVAKSRGVSLAAVCGVLDRNIATRSSLNRTST